MIRAETRESKSKTRVCSWAVEMTMARSTVSKRSDIENRAMLSIEGHSREQVDNEGMVNGSLVGVREADSFETAGKGAVEVGGGDDKLV